MCHYNINMLRRTKMVYWYVIIVVILAYYTFDVRQFRVVGGTTYFHRMTVTTHQYEK